MTLDLSYNPLLCPESEIFWLISTELAGWLSTAGLKLKRIWQRIKYPLLTAVQLFTGRRGHFHARCSLVCSCTWCHVTCRAVCIGKLQDKDVQFSRIVWWFFRDIILNGDYWTEFVVFTLSLKQMLILCIFVLLYRHFVIKTRWNAMNCAKEWPQLLLRNIFFLFFLIGTENVKQSHIVLNETQQCWKWRQLMGNKWANAAERTRDCSDPLQLPLRGIGGRRSEHAPYLKCFNYALHNHKIKLAMR